MNELKLTIEDILLIIAALQSKYTKNLQLEQDTSYLFEPERCDSLLAQNETIKKLIEKMQQCIEQLRNKN